MLWHKLTPLISTRSLNDPRLIPRLNRISRNSFDFFLKGQFLIHKNVWGRMSVCQIGLKQVVKALFFIFLHLCFCKIFKNKWRLDYLCLDTCKSFSEARNICRTQNCSECQNKKQFGYTICSAGILSLQFSWTMNNLSSYYGLVDEE